MRIGLFNIDPSTLSHFVHEKNEGYLRNWKVVLFRVAGLFICQTWLNHKKIADIYERSVANGMQPSRKLLNVFKKGDLEDAIKKQIDKILVPQHEKSPVTSGYLKVGRHWEIYYEESGNPHGIPVVFVHGGPGANALETDHCWFDPEKYRIITFDQRGAGKSRPSAWDSTYPASEFSGLTTKQLADDMELLKKHLNVTGKWLVFGGSWGSTLSLFYAQEHPESTAGLVVRGIFLGKREEYLNAFRDDYMQKILPGWDPESLRFIREYAGVTTHDPEHLVEALKKKIFQENDFKAMYLITAYEDYTDDPTPEMLRQLKELPSSAEMVSPKARSLGIIETHFFNSVYQEFNLMDQKRLDRLKKIPTVIVQGEKDTVCPPENAQMLAQALPQAAFNLVRNGKHSSYGREMTDALVRATDQWAEHPGHFKD